jgi:CRP/FNR family transcriptional regulator, cyclic AMP receptor protein
MSVDPAAVEALASTDLFRSLSKRALNKVAADAHVVHHEAGKEITTEGGRGFAFHLITSGTASVVVGSSRHPDLGPGDYFGEISLIDGKPRSATVTTISEMTTVALAGYTFGPILDHDPEVTKALLLAMCARLRAVEHL